MGHFGSGPGAIVEGVDSLHVRTSHFENAPVGLQLIDSAPVLEKNFFFGSAVGLRVEGSRVPSVIRVNAFVDNATALENRTGLSLQAGGNYWGTADSTIIASLIRGTVDFSDFLLEEPDPTVVDEGESRPLRFALGLGYPNPFNAGVTIPFELAYQVRATLSVYDVLGCNIATLVDQELAGGRHSVAWNGLNKWGQVVASGAYFFRLRAGDFTAQGRILLLR